MKISWAFLEGSFIKFLNEIWTQTLFLQHSIGDDSVVTYLLTVTTNSQMVNPWLQLEQANLELWLLFSFDKGFSYLST